MSDKPVRVDVLYGFKTLQPYMGGWIVEASEADRLREALRQPDPHFTFPKGLVGG